MRIIPADINHLFHISPLMHHKKHYDTSHVWKEGNHTKLKYSTSKHIVKDEYVHKYEQDFKNILDYPPSSWSSSLQCILRESDEIRFQVHSDFKKTYTGCFSEVFNLLQTHIQKKHLKVEMIVFK